MRRRLALALTAVAVSLAACSRSEPTATTADLTARRLGELGDSLAAAEPTSPAGMALLMAAQVVRAGAPLGTIQVAVGDTTESYAAVAAEVAVSPQLCSTMTMPGGMPADAFCRPQLWMVAWQGAAPSVSRVLTVTSDTGHASFDWSSSISFGDTTTTFPSLAFAELVEPPAHAAWWATKGGATAAELSRGGGCARQPTRSGSGVASTCTLATFSFAVDGGFDTQPFWGDPADSTFGGAFVPPDSTRPPRPLRAVRMTPQPVPGIHIEITAMPPMRGPFGALIAGRRSFTPTRAAARGAQVLTRP